MSAAEWGGPTRGSQQEEKVGIFVNRQSLLQFIVHLLKLKPAIVHGPSSLWAIIFSHNSLEIAVSVKTEACACKPSLTLD